MIRMYCDICEKEISRDCARDVYAPVLEVINKPGGWVEHNIIVSAYVTFLAPSKGQHICIACVKRAVAEGTENKR